MEQTKPTRRHGLSTHSIMTPNPKSTRAHKGIDLQPLLHLLMFLEIKNHVAVSHGLDILDIGGDMQGRVGSVEVGLVLHGEDGRVLGVDEWRHGSAEAVPNVPDG